MRSVAMWLPLGVLVLASALSAQQPGDGSVVVEAGALRLTWSRAGRVARVQCGSDDVTGSGVAASGFALRDCAAQETYEPVSGALAAAADGMRFAGRNAAGALAVSATCKSRSGWLVVRGEVENLTEAVQQVVRISA